MKRRAFVLAALGVASGQPRRVLAQIRLKRVGWIGAGARSTVTDAALGKAFMGRLRELGWIEGRTIEFVRHGGEEDRIGADKALEAAARALVAEKVDLIFAPFGPHAMIARKATRDIPIVFAIIGNPVAAGLADSLARPGGNATGPTTQEDALREVRLQMLREAVPGIRRVAILMNPDVGWNVNLTKSLADVCAKLGLEPLPIAVRRREDLAPAIEQAVRERADALLHMPDGFYFNNRPALVNGVGRTRIAATYTNAEYVDDGGLMAYAIDVEELMRKAANYVDRILRGARPGELPVEQASRFEFVINLKTAKAQGIRIPQSVLLRATRVIE